MCGRNGDCVGGLENGKTGDCVGELESVWEDWIMCGRTRDCVGGWRMRGRTGKKVG